MSRFWKMLSRMNVRLLLAASVAGLLAVLAWRIRFEVDLARQQEMEEIAMAGHAPPRAASDAEALPMPDEKRNPFVSSHLSDVREQIKRERERELARLKELADQRRGTEEAARIATEAATQPTSETPVASDAGIPPDPVAPEAVAESKPRALTLVYKGMLVRTDGVRLALIGKNAQDGYYPAGSSLEWLSIQEFSRDTLTVKIGDRTIDLQREQPFTSQEP